MSEWRQSIFPKIWKICHFLLAQWFVHPLALHAGFGFRFDSGHAFDDPVFLTQVSQGLVWACVEVRNVCISDDETSEMRFVRENDEIFAYSPLHLDDAILQNWIQLNESRIPWYGLTFLEA